MKFLAYNVIGFLILGLAISVSSQSSKAEDDVTANVDPQPLTSTEVPIPPPTNATTIVPPTTTSGPPTTTNGTTTTPQPTTSSTTPLTTTSSTTPPTTLTPPTSAPPHSNGTTTATTTSLPPTTNSTTTTKPPPAPSGRKFDLPSFIGGFVLAAGLMAIGVISWKFYLSRQENYYHTL